MFVTHTISDNALNMWYYNEQGVLIFWAHGDGMCVEKQSIYPSLTKIRDYFIPNSNKALIYDSGEP
jgi:hypothetical protein